MKKLIVATGIILGLVVWAAGSASAHVPTVTANCDGLVATGINYNPNFTNTLKIVVDNKIVMDETFTDHFSSTTANPDQTVSHTYSVVIVGGDGIGNVDTEGTIPVCKVPPTTTAPPTTTPTTTTRPVPTTTTVAPQRVAPPVTVVVPTPVTVPAHFTG